VTSKSTNEGRLPQEFPLVGRKTELDRLFTVFGEGASAARLRLLAGESGVGKSRLALTLAAEAERRDWRVLRGRAYPVEQGVPYAVVADAFVPLLQELDGSKLTVLTRGRESDLHRLFPALGIDSPREDGLDPEELRTRLYWTFSSVLKGLARQQPILVVLEDLHWADPSSVALLHFLVRQSDDQEVRIVATYTSEDRERNPQLVQLERSLESLGRSERLDLSPLDLPGVEELLTALFRMSGPPVNDFAERLYGWTRGNPYFVEQTLQALVQQGELYVRDGTWLGWESRELSLPSTVRDAVMVRFQDVSPLAVEAAEIIAVAGRPSHARLAEHVLARERAEISSAVGELVSRGIVEERLREGEVTLQFRHPLSRETLYRGLSLTRRRLLHEHVAAALEAIHGVRAESHADEIAYHLTQNGVHETDPRAARYLGLAGRQALERHADEEATRYLAAALSALGEGDDPATRKEAMRLRRALVRARTRNGQYEEAGRDWAVLLADARERGDDSGQASALRHMGLLAYFQGRHTEALDLFEEARRTAAKDDDALRAQIELAAAMTHQQLGRASDSRDRILRALEHAEAVGNDGLLARIHRGLALENIWTGKTTEAREHGQKALELGAAAGDQVVVFWGQWAMGALEGLIAGPGPMKPWIEAARATAEELGSPLLDLWLDELALEYNYFSGQWDEALALGTRAIQRARVLNQQALLVRILVWTSSVYMGRGDLDQAAALVDEACGIAGINGGSTPQTRDVHVSVPALIGRTALHMARKEYEEALVTGKSGIAVAEASGYVTWVLHRLLPMVGEAHFHLRQLDQAEKVMKRLSNEGNRINHQLSLVWATAAKAIFTWLDGDIEQASVLLREAADSMEEIGILFDSARLRRQLAGRLAQLGRTDEAVAELRRVHKVFKELGAEPEYRSARSMFDELDAARPTEHGAASGGPESLSLRRFQVAELVARRMSNKEIAEALDIKVRTVTTHLSAIYQILEIGGSDASKRTRLGDMIREGRILPPEES
jgi:ATP/maltotriose-dependent transcriptional regulator MalT